MYYGQKKNPTDFVFPNIVYFLKSIIPHLDQSPESFPSLRSWYVKKGLQAFEKSSLKIVFEFVACSMSETKILHPPFSFYLFLSKS